MNKYEIKELLLFASHVGKLMLESGAETYRVENTIEYIVKSRKIKDVQIFVIPTSIIVSVEHSGELFTRVERIHKIAINLTRISVVNELSREFVGTDLSIRDANLKLKSIEIEKQFKNATTLIAGGVAGGFFTLLFNGGVFELIGAFFASILVVSTVSFLEKRGSTHFVTNICGGIMAALVSTLFYYIYKTVGVSSSVDVMIIGSIMPLVPGVALTNAVRDSISGDYVSGLSRTAEVLVIGLGIAFGVGLVVNYTLNHIGGM
jgi:uncharacterized membrane protein YjjP (DUF1212 family)